MPFDYSRGLPPATEFGADQEEISQRQRLARILQQQGMQSPQGGMAGRVYVPPSITQGLAQMMQAYAGGKMQQDAGNESRQLADKRAAALAEAMKGFGQPQTVEAPAPSPEAVGPFQGQEQPYDYAQGLGKLAQIDPRAVAYGQAIMGNQERTREHKMQRDYLDRTREDTQAAREADRIARAEDAMAKVRETEAGRKERQQAGFDQQESMKRLAAGMRQPPQPRAPVMIQDPNDPTQAIYADASQAIGKRAFNQKTATGAGAAEYAPPEGYQAVKLPRPLASAQASAASEAVTAASQAEMILTRQQALHRDLSKKYGAGAMAKGMAYVAKLSGADPLLDEYISNQNELVLQAQILQKGPQTESDAKRMFAAGAEVSQNPEAHEKVIRRQLTAAKRAAASNEAALHGYAIVPTSGKGGAGGTGGNGGAGGLSPEEQAELDALRKRFGK